MNVNFCRPFVALLGLLSVLAWTDPVDLDFENSHLDEQEAIIRERIPSVVTIVNPIYNPAVRSYLNTYIYSRPEQTGYMLGWAKYYFPKFEKALQDEGLPSDLKYLAIVESALNPNAISRSGAGGLWQFMKPTARECGLKCGTYVDERMDPEKSSIAAALYLKRLYAMFGNWELVMAAYNAGPGRVRSAMKRAGSDNYWKVAKYLPLETRTYVPGFIAASYLLNFYTEHDLIPIDPLHALGELTPVVIHQGMHLSVLAKKSGLTTEIVKALNPSFVRNYIPASQSGYTIWLPAASAEAFNNGLIAEPIIASSFETMTEEETAGEKKVVIGGELYKVKTITKYYTVRSGDNLYDLAKRNNCTVKELMNWNGLHNSRLSIGQKLELRKSVRELITTDEPGDLMASADNTITVSKYETKILKSYYTVRSGDNLHDIANRQGCTVKELMSWNKLHSTRLRIGQKLELREVVRKLIPVVETPPPPAPREDQTLNILPTLLVESLPLEKSVQKLTFEIEPSLPLHADQSIILKRRQSLRQALGVQLGSQISTSDMIMPKNIVAGDVVKWKTKA